MSDQIGLKILGVESAAEIDGAQHLTINTTRGPIPMIFHPAAEPNRAALCVSGAIGGVDGPSKLYPRLGRELPSGESRSRGSTTARRTNSASACSTPWRGCHFCARSTMNVRR
jgi:hypothetical protein